VLGRVDARIQPKDNDTMIRAEEVGDERIGGTERQITQTPRGALGGDFFRVACRKRARDSRASRTSSVAQKSKREPITHSP
jgi:hypothetical protein